MYRQHEVISKSKDILNKYRDMLLNRLEGILFYNKGELALCYCDHKSLEKSLSRNNSNNNTEPKAKLINGTEDDGIGIELNMMQYQSYGIVIDVKKERCVYFPCNNPFVKLLSPPDWLSDNGPSEIPQDLVYVFQYDKELYVITDSGKHGFNEPTKGKNSLQASLKKKYAQQFQQLALATHDYVFCLPNKLLKQNSNDFDSNILLFSVRHKASVAFLQHDDVVGLSQKFSL